MLDVVGNPEDRLFRDTAHNVLDYGQTYQGLKFLTQEQPLDLSLTKEKMTINKTKQDNMA